MNWVKDDRGIRSTIEEYFKNLFTTWGQRDWGSLLDCVKQVVTTEMNEVLTSPVKDEEIKKHCVPDGQPQSPGPQWVPGCLLLIFLGDHFSGG